MTHREPLGRCTAHHGRVVRRECGEASTEIILDGGCDFVVYGRVQRA